MYRFLHSSGRPLMMWPCFFVDDAFHHHPINGAPLANPYFVATLLAVFGTKELPFSLVAWSIVVVRCWSILLTQCLTSWTVKLQTNSSIEATLFTLVNGLPLLIMALVLVPSRVLLSTGIWQLFRHHPSFNRCLEKSVSSFCISSCEPSPFRGGWRTSTFICQVPSKLAA